MKMIGAVLIVVMLSGCASGISGYNAYNNATKLTSEGVRAEGVQTFKNLLSNYNKSRGGF
jgi:PBP1b-binding outer membrane lipoprotein LpoB